MNLGFHSIGITPDLDQNVELMGYGYFLHRRAQSIEDCLTADTLIIEGDNKTAAAIVATHLYAVSAEFTSRIRAAAERRIGIPQQNVMVTASHSHSAPGAAHMFACGEPDQSYLNSLIPKIIDSMEQAYDKRKLGNIGFASASVPDLTYNRRGRELTFPNLWIAKAVTEDFQYAMTNFASHPVVRPRDAATSRDYPGIVVDELKQRIDGVLWTTGCCADLNPKASQDKTYTRTIKDKINMGKKIAKIAAKVYETIDTCGGEVNVASSTIAIPLDKGYGEKVIARMRGMAERENFAQFVQEAESRMKEAEQSVTAEIMGIKIGNYTVLGLPAEIYSSTGQAIQALRPGIFPLTFANGMAGYVAPPEEFDAMSYEAGRAQLSYQRAPFTKNCEQILRQGAASVLAEIEEN